MTTKKIDEKSFGAKMKQLRQVRKISFEQLANKTGFSQRYLKEIEEGVAIPPVSAVIQIAKALAINAGSFLSAEEREASVKRRKESFYKRTQAYSYKTLTLDAETKHMKAFLVTIDPKQDHKMVEYKHDGEEFLYVLRRDGTQLVDAEFFQDSSGQVYHVLFFCPASKYYREKLCKG